jgi:hypothetical protein
MVDAVEDNAVLGAGEGREGLMNPPPPPPPPPAAAEEGMVDAMVSFFTADPRVSSLAGPLNRQKTPPPVLTFRVIRKSYTPNLLFFFLSSDRSLVLFHHFSICISWLLRFTGWRII